MSIQNDLLFTYLCLRDEASLGFSTILAPPPLDKLRTISSEPLEQTKDAPEEGICVLHL